MMGAVRMAAADCSRLRPIIYSPSVRFDLSASARYQAIFSTAFLAVTFLLARSPGFEILRFDPKKEGFEGL